VIWHVSQALLVGKCRPLLPVAVSPLWQSTQSPLMKSWSKAIGSQFSAEWQELQLFGDGGWFELFPGASIELWHATQSVGVPDNLPST